MLYHWGTETSEINRKINRVFANCHQSGYLKEILNLVILLCPLGFGTRSYATVHQTSLTAVRSSRHMVAVSVLVGANPKTKWKQLGRANPHKKSLCIRNPISVVATRSFFVSRRSSRQENNWPAGWFAVMLLTSFSTPPTRVASGRVSRQSTVNRSTMKDLNSE